MTRKIAVLTDSACDIPPELEKKYGIDILPFVITLDGVSYVERRDFGFDEALSEDSAYWKAFRAAPESNINAFCEALRRAKEDQMVDAFRGLLERYPDDNAKIKEFLCKNLRYLRTRMMAYIRKHIELFY